jgi:hypothetical protein
MDLGVNAILQTAGKTMSSDQDGSVLFCLDSCTMKQGGHQSFQNYVAKKLQELEFQIIYRDEYLTSQMFPGSGSKTEFVVNKYNSSYIGWLQTLGIFKHKLKFIKFNLVVNVIFKPPIIKH